KKLDVPAANADPVTRALFDLKSPSPHRRRAAAEQLAQNLPNERREEVAGALEPLLTDPDMWTRNAAAKALGRWGTKDSVTALIKAVRYQESSTRTEAIKALAKLKDERAVDVLLEAIKHEDVGTRAAAIDALAELKDDRAIEPLIARLADFFDRGHA